MIYFFCIKKSRLSIWTLSIFMLATLAVSAQSRLSGTVADAETRTPIAGASVNINGSVSGSVSVSGGYVDFLVCRIPNAENKCRRSDEEIESIQVLKDAGSAAIYGLRGVNGVIIVTQ